MKSKEMGYLLKKCKIKIVIKEYKKYVNKHDYAIEFHIIFIVNNTNCGIE